MSERKPLRVVSDVHAGWKADADAKQEGDLLIARALATLAHVHRAWADVAYALREAGVAVDIGLRASSNGEYWYTELSAKGRKIRAQWTIGKGLIDLTGTHVVGALEPVPVPDNGRIMPEAQHIADILAETL